MASELTAQAAGPRASWRRGHGAWRHWWLPASAIAAQSYTTLRISQEGAVTLGDILVVLSLMTIGFAGVFRGRRIWMPGWIFLPAFLVILSYLGHFLPGGVGNPGEFTPMVMIVFCLTVLPVWIVNLSALDESRALVLARIFVAGNALGALVAILYHHGFSVPGLDGYTRVVARRQAGLTLHPTSLGMFCALALPMSTMLAMSASGRGRIFWGVQLLLLLYAIDLSGSRKAIVAGPMGAFVVVAAWLIYSRRGEAAGRAMVLLAVACAVTLLLLLGTEGGETALARLTTESWTARLSDQIRERLTATAWADFWSSVSFGTDYRDHILAHNNWLSMARCGGLFGLAAVLIRDLAFGWFILKAMQSACGRSQSGFLVGAAAVGTYVVWLAVCLKESVGFERQPALGLAIALALAMSMLERPREIRGARDEAGAEHAWPVVGGHPPGAGPGRGR